MRTKRRPQDPTDDVIDALGALAFASRLKRLHERLIRDVGRVYEGLGFSFEPRWFLLFYSLSTRKSATITELASSLSQSPAAVNQVAGELLEASLIAEARLRGDDRKRLLKLTSRGRTLASKMIPIWQEIGKATSGLLADSGFDLIAGLAATERALDACSIYDRVRLARGESLTPPIEIVDYRPAFKKHFRDLNYAWLREHFMVEAEDERLLSDPRGKIINRGGAVLFARVGEEVVGTCALIRYSASEFELAKMAVHAQWRRRGIGRALVKAAIDRAKRLRCRRLFLLTSEGLPGSVELYQSMGFAPRAQAEKAASKYQRSTAAMDMALRPKSRIRKRSKSYAA